VPDVWSVVSELDATTQARLGDVLETRGSDAQQRAMRQAFLAGIEFPPTARVLEVGCGTGVLTRTLAGWPNVATVVGVDPAPALLERARAAASDLDNLSFQEADGRSLPFDDREFDVAIFDSTLCHVPEPERAVAEAFRVLKEGGLLAAFDGDYATTTVAMSQTDPLQACVEAMMANSVNDRWLVRRLPAMANASGFQVLSFRGHSFIDTSPDGYMRTVVERGIDILHSTDQISSETATALRAEIDHRAAAGTFFGHVAYGALVAQKRGSPAGEAS
jgi:ubiquinone/menaquinone biosynthesis C-methylase UbiE